MESDFDFGAVGLADDLQWESDMGSGVDTSGAPSPSFVLEEEYSSRQSFRGKSYGASQFITLSSDDSSVSDHIFTVYKSCNPANCTIKVSIHSRGLAGILARYGLVEGIACDINPILRNRPELQTVLETLRKPGPENDEPLARDLQLFINDFQLDSAIFSGHMSEVDPDLTSSILWWARRRYRYRLDTDTLGRSFDNLFHCHSSVTSDYEMKQDQMKQRQIEQSQAEQKNSEQRQLIARLRKRFGKAYETLKDQKRASVICHPVRMPGIAHNGDLSSELIKFAIPPNLHDAWKKAVRVIRRLLQNRLPETVEDFVLCTMAADAMQYELKTFTNQEFLRDLDRWREVIQESDKRLYDYMMYKLWDKIPGNRPTASSSSDDVTSYFQRLFQKLLTDTGVEHWSLGSPNGERLSVIQSQFSEHNPTSSGSYSNNSGPRTEPNTPDRRLMIDKGRQPPNAQLLLLAATVIFSAAIAIILTLYHPIENARANNILQRQQFQGFDALSTLKRNCILLACYLGLSTWEIENTSGRRRSPTDMIPCNTCGSQQQRRNMARHMKTHNKAHKETPVHECGSCGYKTERSDNLRTHKRKHCNPKRENVSTVGEAILTPSTQQELATPSPGQPLPSTGTDTIGTDTTGTDTTGTQQTPSTPSTRQPSPPFPDESYFPPIQTHMGLPILGDEHHSPTSNAAKDPLDTTPDWSLFDSSQDPLTSNFWQDTFMSTDLDMFATNTDRDISPSFSVEWIYEQMAQMAQMPLFPLDGNNSMF